MSEQQYQDPSANTAQFQAFAQRTEPEPAPRSALPLIIGVVAAIVVLGAVIAFLITS
jgi:1,4-dihydroxy-2-naphthoate octaprenyltransferase